MDVMALWPSWFWEGRNQVGATDGVGWAVRKTPPPPRSGRQLWCLCPLLAAGIGVCIAKPDSEGIRVAWCDAGQRLGARGGVQLSAGPHIHCYQVGGGEGGRGHTHLALAPGTREVL